MARPTQSEATQAAASPLLADKAGGKQYDAEQLETKTRRAVRHTETELTDEKTRPASIGQHNRGNEVSPAIVPVRKRLGKYVITMNTLALVGLAISISVISWIWFGDRQQPRLKGLILGDYLGQTVTLCSILVRIAVATQATTVVSLLASIALEQRSVGGVRLVDAPGFSIARYSNEGPLASLPVFWKGLSKKRNWPLVVLILTSTLSIASQFTSTLLLWDIDAQDTVSEITAEIGVGFRYDTWLTNNLSTVAWQGRNYWTAPVLSAPAFAEFATQPQGESEAVQDTGPSLRAFLPIAEQEARSQTYSFEGTATVFDSRVVCARPKFNFTEFGRSASGYTQLTGSFQHGETAEDLDGVLKIPNGRTSSFNISIADAIRDSLFFVQLGTQHGGLISSLNPFANKTLNITDSYGGGSWTGSHYNVKNDTVWPVDIGHAFFVIHRFPSPKQYSSGYTPVRAGHDGVGYDVNVVEDGVWAEYGDIQATAGTAFGRITVCYDAYPAQHLQGISRVKQHHNFPIRARRDEKMREPSLAWDDESLRFNTTGISGIYSRTENGTRATDYVLDRTPVDTFMNTLQNSWRSDALAVVTLHSMNQNQGTPADTGVELWLPLSNSSELETWNRKFDPQRWSPSNVLDFTTSDVELFGKREYYDFLNTVLWTPFRPPSTVQDFDEGRSRPSGFQLLAICSVCNLQTGDPMMHNTTVLNPTLGNIAFDVFQASGGDPAKTWQALLTAVMSSAYYDWLPTFSDDETVTITRSVQRNQPVRYVGYAIAMSVVAAHLVVAGLVLLHFVRETRLSSIESAWQVVSQLVAPETYSILAQATTLRDSEIPSLASSQDASREDHGESSSISSRQSRRRVILQRFEGDTIGVAEYPGR